MKQLWVEQYRPDTIDGYVFVDDRQRDQVHNQGAGCDQARWLAGPRGRLDPAHVGAGQWHRH